MVSELVTKSTAGKNRDITHALAVLGFGVKTVTARTSILNSGKLPPSPCLKQSCEATATER